MLSAAGSFARWNPPARRAIAAVFAVCLANARCEETLERGLARIHFDENERTDAEESANVIEKGIERYRSRLDPGQDPIDVYLCSTLQEFYERGGNALGGRVEGFARGREGTIVIRTRDALGPSANYPAVLRHELLHVLIARNARAGTVPRWLNEGVAMLLSGEGRWSNTFHLAKMYTSGRVIEYSELEGAFAAPGNETEFGDAYEQSFSMTRHLMRRIGDDTFWRVFRSKEVGDFATVLKQETGVKLERVYDEWRGSLWKVAVITAVISGIGVFQFGALLLIAAWWRKRRKARRIIQAWGEDDEDDDVILPWQLEGQEASYPWEDDDDR